MKLSEIGLVILAFAAVTGFFVVVAGGREIAENENGIPEETDPLVLIERDFAEICCGSVFRAVQTASADTMVVSMDLLDTISVNLANLRVTRAFRSRGFDHVVTYLVPDKGLSFLCHTPDGEPVRFELNSAIR